MGNTEFCSRVISKNTYFNVFLSSFLIVVCLAVFKRECKTDMDNSYQFGHIEVSCEGYSHPDDAYILKGSCGLEYTLELTEEGRARQRSGSTHGSKQSGGRRAGSVFATMWMCVCIILE